MAGLDASERLEYVGVVLGESSVLRDVCRRLKAKYLSIHCRRLPPSLNRRLVAILLEEEVECICLSTRISRVVADISATYLAKGVRAPRREIRARVERALGGYLAKLLFEHSVERVYADAELVPVLRLAGVAASPGYAAELADPIAWANYKKLRVRGLEERDVSEYLLRAALRRA